MIDLGCQDLSAISTSIENPTEDYENGDIISRRYLHGGGMLFSTDFQTQPSVLAGGYWESSLTQRVWAGAFTGWPKAGTLTTVTDFFQRAVIRGCDVLCPMT